MNGLVLKPIGYEFVKVINKLDLINFRFLLKDNLCQVAKAMWKDILVVFPFQIFCLVQKCQDMDFVLLVAATVGLLKLSQVFL